MKNSKSNSKTLESSVARVFNLNDESWMKHANPVSVWTRYSVLPVIVLAFWSRKWIGWWCLVPGLLAIAWMFLNVHVFPKAKSTKNWASKAVLGERVLMNRKNVPIPQIHRGPMKNILNGISSIGMIIAIWAIVYYSVWGAVLGISLAYLGKSWYLDRMVWLYEDMKNENEEYRSWEY